jgi:UTP--glucose-1-phosphate uridylyltransferase
MKKLRKCVFPVAGFGTRFLPATKAVPKELLPVVDRPLIQYAVDEALAAGIEEMIFVTGRNKGAIEDYFDKAFEIETDLEAKGKLDILADVRATRLAPGRAAFVRQQEMAGLGHAVWCARDLIGDEPFAVILPDELLWNRANPCLAQMAATYAAKGGNVISVLEVPEEHTNRYGIVDPGAVDGRVTEVKGFVEKPKLGTARGSRPLHPPARGARHPRRRREGCRRRDPAHRRTRQADRPAAVPRLDLRRHPP